MINILELGGVNDGKTLNTEVFQLAINQAHHSGGDMIYIPAGKYLVSNLYLKSNVHIHFEVGSELVASENLHHYDVNEQGHNKDRQPYHLFIGDHCENILIDGKGIINGQGPLFWKDKPDARGWYKEKQQRVSPLFELTQCRNITFHDFTILDSPGWTIHLNVCKQINMRSIRILNHILGPNTDAIDINGCQDVMISDCHIEAGDDAIVLKTTPDAGVCERITVTNCLLRSNCVGFKLGATESFYDMRQITFSNSIIYHATRPIGIYALEGGSMEDITITNIVADTHGTPSVGLGIPIHLDLRRRNEDSKLGSINNVQITNFIARTKGKIMLTAEKGAYLNHIFLRDIHLIYDKGFSDARLYKDWSSAQFSNKSKEARVARTACVADGVHHLYMDNFMVTWPEERDLFDMSALWLKNIHKMHIHAPLLEPYKENLITLEGQNMHSISDLLAKIE
ncbi:right-handed parallel beta-helix repeat-containing protein [Vallitalea pronyensis]|uniref:Right-handed parallel beta-helix repeat-containing protein n=1 Tax=Vallitalea pronyensis TaxID=1348613 RepID=A0A8J8MMY0_9FIRM|nr:glycosyl hydrolase family 28 protein [Vallitalea pronyensis]QUI24630.1 right-handed parallel beta-helix repeat-containing protein [Vallitalea pronyensis]